MIKKLAVTGVLGLAVTGSILSAAPANADIDTSGENGVASGNQAVVPVNAPVSLCGNALAVIGNAGAGCLGNATVLNKHHHHH
ncbi:chaplin family protein [Actinomadura rubrisoli]|uniref:Chaplin n=1 Tax=Actinomadura rubrisoli TaxID=2530368 RepID=A0A4R5BGH9_9ACTN|nr:chaplin family protein [Actinomadura rubrisoli]TDD82944.1 chaplin [Actinomadura rubrisoli]